MSPVEPPKPSSTSRPEPAGGWLAEVMVRFRYVVLPAVIVLGLVAVATVVWASALAVRFVARLLDGGWDSSQSIAELLTVIDLFLIATVLVIIVIGLFELFIARLPAIPDWLEVKDLTKLKDAVGELIVLVLAIKFIEKFVSGKDPDELLKTAIATTLVGGLLVAFVNLRRKP